MNVVGLMGYVCSLGFLGVYSYNLIDKIIEGVVFYLLSKCIVFIVLGYI